MRKVVECTVTIKVDFQIFNVTSFRPSDLTVTVRGNEQTDLISNDDKVRIEETKTRDYYDTPAAWSTASPFDLRKSSIDC
jgi:hypothetical protein